MSRWNLDGWVGGQDKDRLEVGKGTAIAPGSGEFAPDGEARAESGSASTGRLKTKLPHASRYHQRPKRVR